MRSTALTGAGGVLAAFFGSLCCVGPLLFVAVGVGAGFASTLEPYRPLFGAVMLACLALGFWTVYGRRLAIARSDVAAPGACARPADAACEAPTRHHRDVALLWGATMLALVLWTFPRWSLWLL